MAKALKDLKEKTQIVDAFIVILDSRVPLASYNEELDLIAIKDTNGDVVWLDTYYVKLNQGKVVDLPCYKIGTTGAQDRRETGTMGFGGTCEDAN